MRFLKAILLSTFCFWITTTQSAPIPSDLKSLLKSSNLNSSWVLDESVTPLYLKGAFTGGRENDYAISLKAKHGNNSTIAIITHDKKAYLTSNEKEIGSNYPGPDWKIHSKKDPVSNRLDLNKGSAPVLKNDAIELSKPESSSAILYWDAGHLHLYWLSD
jgi:hypothetical protein